MGISSIRFAWARLNIQYPLEELSLSQNWNEVLIKEGWEKYLVIEKPFIVELAFACWHWHLPNIPCNWEFSDFAGNDKQSFIGCAN
jgi:hypothetical protein